MDPFELMAMGLGYIEKSGKVLAALPRDYWPNPDNLERCRQTVARARVLLALGEEMCERATPGVTDYAATRIVHPAAVA